MPADVSETDARLKNMRRLTPMASGSGGVHGTGAALGALASPVPGSAVGSTVARSRVAADFGLLAGAAGDVVALAGLARERAGTPHVGPAGGRHEDDGRQHDCDPDDEGDDSCG